MAIGEVISRRRNAWLATSCGLCLLTSAAMLTRDSAAAPSRLWGEHGELWDPAGRLPDVSHAGYRAGRAPIPDLPVVTDVRDFGAVGDGVTDDSAAFAAALAATENGALLVPAGEYLLRTVLTIDRSGVVIRGEGPDATVLTIDRSLTDLNGGVVDPNFSWSGGFLVLSSATPSTPVGTVTAPALRGDRWLALDTVEGIEPDSVVLVQQTDDAAGSFGRHLHNDQEDAERCSGNVVLGWRAQVVQVDAVQRRVELDEPLPVDVRLEWSPQISVLNYLSDSGIEDLGIAFPTTQSQAHGEERGYNAIQLDLTLDAWVRNVAITNADSGIFVSGKRNTILDVVFRSDRPANAAGHQGHHGVGSGQSGLYAGLVFDAEFSHSITVSNQAVRNVFTEIGGSTMVRLDHHRRSPLENVFTAFASPSNFRSGGNGCEGPHAGARNTYWGLVGPVGPPCNTEGSGLCWGHIQSNVVGELAMADTLTDDREWYESVDALVPLDVHRAQLERRLAIEDRDAEFSPLRFGVRTEWQENDPLRWAVIDDDGDPRYFLATTVFDAKPGDRLGEYALATTPALGDVLIAARARRQELPTNNYPDVGLVLGWQDDENYDYAMFNGEAASSAIFAVRDGQRVELVRADHAILTDDAWHDIAFRRTGDVLEMLWDGQIVATTQGVAGVPTPIAGLAGVGSFNDSAWFDDIVIESPDLPDDSDSTGVDTAATSAADDAADSDDAGADAATVGDADTTVADTTTAAQTGSSDGCGCATDRRELAPAFAVIMMALVRRRRDDR